MKAFVLILSMPLLGVSLLAQQLDESWILRVGEQTVRANEDGGFRIDNIAAPDQFGQDGPGTSPDFLSDDFLRLTGFSTRFDPTLYVFSEPFRIRQGGTFRIPLGTLTFTTNPPPQVAALKLSSPRATLTALGEEAQLSAIATLGNGGTLNVTSRELWSTYRTSNRLIADVDADGKVLANGAGKAFITVVNDGTASTLQIDVSPGDPLTEVRGVVQLIDGTPVPGVNLELLGLGGMATSGSDGEFVFSGVATAFGRIPGIMTVYDSSTGLFGFTQGLNPIPGGITDAGVITLESLCDVVEDCVDSDGDCLPDAVEILSVGFDPNDSDSDDDGIPDGQEDPDGDGLIGCAEAFLGTRPDLVDSDGDTLSDDREFFELGLDPSTPDTDMDGLDDFNELALGTDPFIADTDGDGWDDASELLAGMQPLIPDNPVLQQFVSSHATYFNAFELPAPDVSYHVYHVESGVASYFNSYILAAPSGGSLYATSDVATFLNADGVIPLSTNTPVSIHSGEVIYENQ